MSAAVTPDPRRNAELYLDLTAFEAIKRAERTNFGYRPLVYICNPYSGDITANVRLAREFCKVAVARRKIPLAPHLLFPQFMNDNHPAQRSLAMFFNRILLSRCEVMWVYADRVSDGMSQEIDWANASGLPIKYFNSDFKEVRR